VVQGGNPISAVAIEFDDGVRLQVYWRNLHDEIIVKQNAGSWGPTTKVVGGIGSGFQFTLLHWKKGKHLRLYYQNSANVVLEHCSDDNGQTWFPGWKVGGILRSEFNRGSLIWHAPQ